MRSSDSGQSIREDTCATFGIQSTLRTLGIQSEPNDSERSHEPTRAIDLTMWTSSVPTANAFKLGRALTHRTIMETRNHRWSARPSTEYCEPCRRIRLHGTV
jgi:hypothetical protein